MLEKFNDYLSTLPLTKVVKDRIEEVISLNLKIQNVEILDIFISDLKNNEGARTYTSLWLFNERYCMECKNFLNSNYFDVTSLKNKIELCSISTNAFNFESVSDNSSLTIHWQFEGSLTGDLIATEDNCLKAFEIYKKYIVANLK